MTSIGRGEGVGDRSSGGLGSINRCGVPSTSHFIGRCSRQGNLGTNTVRSLQNKFGSKFLFPDGIQINSVAGVLCQVQDRVFILINHGGSIVVSIPTQEAVIGVSESICTQFIFHIKVKSLDSHRAGSVFSNLVEANIISTSSLPDSIEIVVRIGLVSSHGVSLGGEVGIRIIQTIIFVEIQEIRCINSIHHRWN